MRRPLARGNSKTTPQSTQPAPQNQQGDGTITPPTNSGAGRQPATGGRGPALTPITERSTTGETRAYTVGESVSPPLWAQQQQQQQQNASDGGNVIQGGMLVKSPIEEEEEQGGQRPISSLWGGNASYNAETKEREVRVANAEGRGARPISMALGAMNIEGPGATGADPTEEERVATPEPPRSLPPPAPSHAQNPASSSHAQNALGLGTNSSTYGNNSVQSHGPTSASYSSPDMRSDLTLGTGVPEPGAIDLRSADAEHRPGNGHAQAYGGAHSYGNGPQSLNAPPTNMPIDASPKPHLAPIRTTALSPPARNVARQSPAKVEQLPEQPASPPPGAQEPSKQMSASSPEDFIPSEAARFILDQQEDDSDSGLGLTGTGQVKAAMPGQRRTFESSSENEEDEEEEEEEEPVVQPWRKVCFISFSGGDGY